MKKQEFARHEPTGAIIPINHNFISRMEKGEQFSLSEIEKKTDRKYFSLDDICNRWDYDFESIMKMLSEYDIRVFSIMRPFTPDGSIDPKHILIFDEYILALEKKLKIPHKKIKSKKLNIQGH